MINSIQNQRIFHNIRHKKIPIENRGFYSKTLQINIENDRKSSKINVSKLAKI